MPEILVVEREHTRPPNEEHDGANVVACGPSSLEPPEVGSLRRDGWERREHVECLRACARRVKDKECGVTQPGEPRRSLLEERGGVEGVSNDLGEGPRPDHSAIEEGLPGSGVLLCDTPDEDEARSDLNCSGWDRGTDPAQEGMENLENGKRLDDGSLRANSSVYRAGTVDKALKDWRETSLDLCRDWCR